MYYVVGSGPAGIACAHALVDAGREVTILDGGAELEAERDAIRRSAARKPRTEWTREEVEALKTKVPASGEIPLKLVHGSDYPYRPAMGAPDIRYGDMKIRASYAVGGLSNVWGAVLAPFREADISDWPVSMADMNDGYAAVLALLPVSARQDDLSQFFPMPPSPSALKQSRQIKTFLQSAKNNKMKLDANGLFVGSARVAARAVTDGNALGCYYCGHCLHGCPRDAIYSSRHSLTKLLESGRVQYRPGLVVRTLAETSGDVRIEVVGAGGETSHLEGERVFLGAGTINSTAILLRSLGLYDKPVQFKDAQYYLFPMLQGRAARRVAEEALHTLCQGFIEIFDQEISPYTVHLQIYSYNDHLSEMLDHKLGAMRRLFPRSALLGRLLLVQGYLHSVHSGSIVGRLRQTAYGDVFDLEATPNEQTPAKIGQVLAKLRRNAFRLGAFPVSPLLQITEPGRGFHTGGSFPMAETPGPGKTDPLGRPYGMHRTHVVDASVFPSIPATTITLAVMANAYRIGAAIARMERDTGNHLIRERHL